MDDGQNQLLNPARTYAARGKSGVHFLMAGRLIVLYIAFEFSFIVMQMMS